MMPAVLAIAGTDPSGGAGLARDVNTTASLGVAARVVVTAVTVQSDQTVGRIACLAPELVSAQLDAALAGGQPDAIKIGMLGRAATVEILAARLASMSDVPVVLDPVIAASSGTLLIDRAGREAMVDLLLPLTHVLTPNLPEAAALTGLPPASTEAGIEQLAKALLDRGARFVLIKGGHSQCKDAIDRLYSHNRPIRRFSAPRQPDSARGTGCTLASAIAAFLAVGQSADDACEGAKALVLASRFDAPPTPAPILANSL